MSARLLVSLLREPQRAAGLSVAEWNGLICAARAERLIGTLALRLQAVEVAERVTPILADARRAAEREARLALWEADRMRCALQGLDVPVVLLKGTAYAAAGLRAGEGRFIGDLDILVPRERLDEVEAALLAAGWEWLKSDPYDDAYYRQWMHELPPMIHRDRDRMIDVHHTILPLTARPKPLAEAMIADSVLVADGWRVLNAQDRIVHAAAHMIADGDLAGGLRNLWDIYCLLGDLDDRDALMRRARLHGLGPEVARAARLADALYGAGTQLTWSDRLFVRRLLSCDSWGRDARKMSAFAFYLRSHWLRMPPLMLARHLWTKWRKGYRPV